MEAAISDHSTELARARVGAVLHGKWHIDGLLGIGGMATVYAATHRNGKRAAIKVLHASAACDPVVRARFQREGYVANRVEHPGAVSILDDDEDDEGTVFLVMELLHGETLEDRRIEAGGSLPSGDVLCFMDQVLDTLAAAHAKTIVHRDLKPGNLFLTTAGVVKVLDFGIARLADMKSSPTRTTSFSSSMGTLGFMAPEQARGRWELVDARTDLWSIGATMFTLLCGRYVHEAGTANEQLLEAMTKPARMLASLLPHVHPEVARVVDRALAFEREQRWADAAAMQRAVREAYEALTGRAIVQAPKILGASGRVQENVEHAPTLPAFSGPASTPTATSDARTAGRGSQAATANLRRMATAGAGVALAGALAWVVLGARRGETPVAGAGPAASTATAGGSESTIPSGSASTAAPEAALAAASAPMSAPASESASATASGSGTAAAPSPATAGAAGPRRMRPQAATSTPAPAVAPPPSATVDIFDRRR